MDGHDLINKAFHECLPNKTKVMLRWFQQLYISKEMEHASLKDKWVELCIAKNLKEG